MSIVIDNAKEVFISVYNRYPIVIERGEGVYLYDEDGNKYLDFAAGIAVFALGYSNDIFKNTVKAQVDTLIHTSNFFYNKPSVEAAKKLVKASGMEKVFFTNSGTEAIEGAVKLARKYYYNKTGQSDGEIIAMNHSFHGRSMGALAVTGQPKYQKAFGPMLANIKFADFNDLDSVKAQITDKTCCILLETIQGEGGFYPGTDEFIKGVRALCDEHDLLMICDEIQCGMGRTGDMFAYQGYDVCPDVMTSAKALGCGIPVGAFAARGKAALALQPGDHGTTYGFNPLATAAVDVVFDLYDKLGITTHVKEVGSYLEAQLNQLVEENECMVERRGKGLMQGVELKQPVGDIIINAQKKGLILVPAGANVLRFIPPLIIEKEHVDEMIAILKECLALS